MSKELILLSADKLENKFNLFHQEKLLENDQYINIQKKKNFDDVENLDMVYKIFESIPISTSYYIFILLSIEFDELKYFYRYYISLLHKFFPEKNYKSFNMFDTSNEIFQYLYLLSQEEDNVYYLIACFQNYFLP